MGTLAYMRFQCEILRWGFDVLAGEKRWSRKDIRIVLREGFEKTGKRVGGLCSKERINKVYFSSSLRRSRVQ
jgi:hypothetical protein